MRILLITRETYPTFRVDVDVLFNQELARHGHRIDFVMQASAAGSPASEQQWRNSVVHVGRTVHGAGGAARALRVWRGVCHDVRWIRRAMPSDYDAIIVRDKVFVGAVAALLLRRSAIRRVFWLSFPIPDADILHARSGNARFPLVTGLRGIVFRWLLYRFVLPRYDHVFVQSERMKQEIARKGVDAARMTAVPMGVDLSQLPPPPTVSRPVASGAALLLGYLGTLDANRGLQILIDMLKLLHAQGLPVRLLLVGDAHDQRDRIRLLDHARRSGVDSSVEFTGMLPRAEALARFAVVDVALSPIPPSPIFDVASPTKLVEYLALGIPVVANTHPEQREVLRESGGGICVPWHARHFARAVRCLAGMSGEERAAMGRRARTWVEQNRSYAVIARRVERQLALIASHSGE